MARKPKDETSTTATPKEPGRMKQIWQAFQMVRKAEPLILLWFALALVVIMGAAVAIAFALGGGWYFGYTILLGLALVLLAWMIILSNRVPKVAFRQIEGQPGAALAALKQIRRGWTIQDEPVAIDPKGQDMVFRAVGRPGIVLVGEDRGHIGPLMAKAETRLNKLLPNVPVTTMIAGNGEGHVPLHKVAGKVQRLRPTLTKAEAAAVEGRLRAIGGAKLPVPKGIDPMRARPDRKAMRGR